MTGETDWVQDRAHLRPLPKCFKCPKPATEELYNGRNDVVGRYCSTHAKQALASYKAGRGT